MENIGLLLLLFLSSGRSDKNPEPIFRARGEDIEMGFCFGVDYIAVYKPGPDRDLLLGNSSAESAPSSQLSDYQGRVSITSRPPLLGFQISHLRSSDSGLYHRECWKDGNKVDKHDLQLLVCDQETNAEEILVAEDGGAELFCHSSLAAQEGASVRWYHEVFPNYTTELFLDSRVSLEPLQERLRAEVQAREGGRSLSVTATMLKSSHHFLCLMMAGDHCLSFYNTYLPNPDELSVYRSVGERVVLACPSTHWNTNHRWETPLGHVNATRKSQSKGDQGEDQMFVVDGDKQGYSLVIPALSPNLFGQYSCFSPSLVGKFSLQKCPSSDPRTMRLSEGGTATLRCDVDLEDAGVLWYRERASENDQLILDSRETSVALPEHLRGRATLSEQDNSLILAQLRLDDAGKYYCVVVEDSTGFLEEDEYVDSPPEEEGEEEEEEQYDDTYEDVDEPWLDSDKCFSKQVTDLTFSEGKQKIELTVTEDRDEAPAPAPSSAMYAGVGVGALVLIGIVVVVVVIWKKKSTQKRTAVDQKTKDVEFKRVDTGENVA